MPDADTVQEIVSPLLARHGAGKAAIVVVAHAGDEAPAELMDKVEEGGDLQVATHAYSLSGATSGANYVYSPTWEVGIVSARAQEYTVGTLMVDLIDAASNRNVWQAAAEETFGERNDNKIRKKVDKITRKMFKSYPPR